MRARVQDVWPVGTALLAAVLLGAACGCDVDGDGVSGSDLEPINLLASPLTLAAGDSISFSYEIYNNGPDAATGTVTVERYLSTNATISSADTFLSSGPFIVSGLASGASDSSITLSVTIPSGTAPGSYYFGLLITPDASIGDTNWFNDDVSVAITVTGTSGSDLEPINFSASPLTVAAGGSISFSYSIYNNGPDAATGTVTVERYLSTDAAISSADTFLSSGPFTVSGLAVGASEPSITLSVTIPSGTAAGNYYFGLLITPDAGIGDTNWFNDDISVAITVGGGDDIYEPNNTRATAWDFSGGEDVWLSSYGGELGIQADDDWYEIYVTTNYTLVEIDCTFSDAAGDIDIQLVDASGSVLASALSFSDNEYISHDVAGDGYSGGTFYIRVHWGDAGNSYDLWWDDLLP